MFASSENAIKGREPRARDFFSVRLPSSSERPLTLLAANHSLGDHHCSRVALRVHRHGDEFGLEARMRILSWLTNVDVEYTVIAVCKNGERLRLNLRESGLVRL